jgi:GTP-binding protein
VLLHLVDASGEDPEDAYHVVQGELEAYGAGLDAKEQIICSPRPMRSTAAVSPG